MLKTRKQRQTQDNHSGSGLFNYRSGFEFWKCFALSSSFMLALTKRYIMDESEKILFSEGWRWRHYNIWIIIILTSHSITVIILQRLTSKLSGNNVLVTSCNLRGVRGHRTESAVTPRKWKLKLQCDTGCCTLMRSSERLVSVYSHCVCVCVGGRCTYRTVLCVGCVHVEFVNECVLLVKF